MNLTGRVVIVTGAGGGLGRSHALFLARQGAQVVVNYLDENAADRVVQQWETISDRNDEIVPGYGFMQAEREVASAGLARRADKKA